MLRFAVLENKNKMRLGNTYEGMNPPHKPDVKTNLFSYNPGNFITDGSKHENRLDPTNAGRDPS